MAAASPGPARAGAGAASPAGWALSREVWGGVGGKALETTGAAAVNGACGEGARGAVVRRVCLRAGEAADRAGWACLSFFGRARISAAMWERFGARASRLESMGSRGRLGRPASGWDDAGRGDAEAGTVAVFWGGGGGGWDWGDWRTGEKYWLIVALEAGGDVLVAGDLFLRRDAVLGFAVLAICLLEVVRADGVVATTAAGWAWLLVALGPVVVVVVVVVLAAPGW